MTKVCLHVQITATVVTELKFKMAEFAVFRTFSISSLPLEVIGNMLIHVSNLWTLGQKHAYAL